MEQSSNPLRQFFRQPAIYIRLPSQGKFWPPGSIDIPADGELPILPMTAIDEITYRTPDALFNGNAVVSVLQSCVPNIIDAWQTPSTDLDTLLVAIRIASFGHAMGIDTSCPNCGHEAEYEADLRALMDNLKSADYQSTVRHGDMEIFFQPLSYRQITQNSIRQFEEQKVMNMMPDTDLTESDKITRLNQAIARLTDLTVDALAQCVSMIRTPQAQVTEMEYIREFLANTESRIFNEIRDHVIGLRGATDLPPLKIQCSNCEHRYEQPVTLDQSFFFADAS